MLKLLGILIVIASVLGGFVLSHGKLLALWQPFELLIIGGAALGGFMISNPWSVQLSVLKRLPNLFFGSRFNRAFYMDLLGLLYDLLNKSRRDGMMSIEADVDDPDSSAVFTRYPAILKDRQLTDFIADYLRLMSSGNMAPHELESLFDMEIETRLEELERPGSAVIKVADALPGFGIVAAVLGIVISMEGIAGPPEELGAHVAAALVGTFIGILAAYGFVGPLGTALEQGAQEELNGYETVKACLVSSLGGMPPALAVEFGRKAIYSDSRPSFTELENHVRGR
ncbi:flagellar motor stator protein MotA [Aestuariirhabdus litorea]|uniref:Flagellar motor stator protein MotA n=1 Tax=Aestuariirhabdus litorea TaxID=2528527 RepID=A0A3P3VNB6_9GAMM|nr:flagellar motor stator protein MotA [Aestuariirhabdus litorea]RRJ82323.1 flagellar motor stator protein MotA [Aestuariirhabdus litorea]RWW92488.1 flagellar motor stator protein MotA [Endozoicomonadaceae bacterium GTF-13]